MGCKPSKGQSRSDRVYAVPTDLESGAAEQAAEDSLSLQGLARNLGGDFVDARTAIDPVDAPAPANALAASDEAARRRREARKLSGGAGGGNARQRGGGGAPTSSKPKSSKSLLVHHDPATEMEHADEAANGRAGGADPVAASQPFVARPIGSPRPQRDTAAAAARSEPLAAPPARVVAAAPLHAEATVVGAAPAGGGGDGSGRAARGDARERASTAATANEQPEAMLPSAHKVTGSMGRDEDDEEGPERDDDDDESEAAVELFDQAVASPVASALPAGGGGSGGGGVPTKLAANAPWAVASPVAAAAAGVASSPTPPGLDWYLTDPLPDDLLPASS